MAPGGVAIIAKSPWTVRLEKIPILEKWRIAARLVVGRVMGAHGDSIMCVSVYGYPPSHCDFGKNEDLFRDIFMSMKDLTLPVVVAGDLNTTCMQSETLSRIESLGFVRISNDASTTMTKVGCAKKGDPIDHVVVNLRMRDLVTKVRVNRSLVISDHYPLCVKLVTRPLGQPVVRWPSKPEALAPAHASELFAMGPVQFS